MTWPQTASPCGNHETNSDQYAGKRAGPSSPGALLFLNRKAGVALRRPVSGYFDTAPSPPCRPDSRTQSLQWPGQTPQLWIWQLLSKPKAKPLLLRYRRRLTQVQPRAETGSMKADCLYRAFPVRRYADCPSKVAVSAISNASLRSGNSPWRCCARSYTRPENWLIPGLQIRQPANTTILPSLLGCLSQTGRIGLRLRFQR